MQAFRIVYMVVGAAWMVLAVVTMAQGSVSPNLIMQLAVGIGLVAYGWSRYSRHQQGP